MAAALRCHPHTQVRCSPGRPAACAPPAGLDERKQIYPFVRALDSWLPLCSGSRPRDDREYVVDHPPAMLPRLLAPHTPRVLGAAHTRSRLPPYLPPARSRIPSMPKTPRSSAVASKHGRAIIYAPSVQPAQVRLGHVVSLLNQPGASPKAASRWLPQHMALRQRRALRASAFTSINPGSDKFDRGSGHPLTYGFNCTKGWDPGLLGTRAAFPQAARCAFFLLSRKYKLYSSVWIIEKSTDLTNTTCNTYE